MPIRLHPLARRHSLYTLYTPYSCYGSTGHACYIPAPFSS